MAPEEELTLNPFEPGFFDNPYDQYRRLREARPVHQSPLGPWTLTRYEDVSRLLRDPSLSVQDDNAATDRHEGLFPDDPERRRRGSLAILNLDPPDHTRIRRLVSKAFTPRRIETLLPRVQSLVDEMLESVASNGRMDVIADLAFPLPFAVISEMLGMPEADRDQLRGWSHTLVKTLEPLLTVEDVPELMAASDSMIEHVTAAIEWKRATPSDDLLSAMVAAEEEGDRLSTEELVAQVVLLFVAGHETTVNLIGNGTLALLRNPAQLAELRADPSLIANAIDELLRYDSPVQFSRRIALQPIEVDGNQIEPGSFVFTILGAANHDPEHFGPDADELDLRRRDAPHHLSFGGGIHHCLGAVLARAEARAAIGTLAARFPDLAPANDTPAWNGRLVLRGLDSLPVTL
ncbi:MAG: cytochrome P450 [Actinobacteria bacterium]|nr:cytochrome P450 [Actinomycetota bacterium]